MNIKITNEPDEAFESLLLDGLRSYNRHFSKGTVEKLSVYASDNTNELSGGLSAVIFGNWLHVDVLWVDAAERGKGLGSKILAAAEQEAIQRECTGSTLDTYSFQALDFYLKHGYSQFGQLEGYAGRYTRHYLQKRLT